MRKVQRQALLKLGKQRGEERREIEDETETHRRNALRPSFKTSTKKEENLEESANPKRCCFGSIRESSDGLNEGIRNSPSIALQVPPFLQARQTSTGRCSPSRRRPLSTQTQRRSASEIQLEREQHKKLTVGDLSLRESRIRMLGGSVDLFGGGHL